MPLRFIHTADLHLGSPFIGLERVEPRIAAKLRNSMFGVWNAIVDLSIGEDVDAVMIAGDVIDGSDRREDSQRAFQTGIARLHDAGIRSFVCHGNHDPLHAWTNELDLPDSCHRFGAEVETVPVDPTDPDRGAVVGISYATSDVTDNLALLFERSTTARFTIGLLHCNVAHDPNHAAFAPCTVSDLRRSGIDYWALGHIHNWKVIREGATTIVYPGIPQGRHPGEPGARGVALVTIDDGGHFEIEFRAIDQVRWQRCQLALSGDVSTETLKGLIVAAFERELSTADGRNLVCTMKLSGSVPRSVVDHPEVRAVLTAHVNATFSDTRPWLWCQRIST